MSKVNLRNHLQSSKEKSSLDNRFMKLLQTKKSLKSSDSTSMHYTSSNSSANISFMKDMNFPKLFDQTPMLFSFNPQTTKNSTSMTRSISSSGLNSGARTPNSSYSSFKGFFKSKDDDSKPKNMFNRKQKDITIDLSKKAEDNKSKRQSLSKEGHKYNSSVLSNKNMGTRKTLITNPDDLTPKEENIKVFIRIKPPKQPQVSVGKYKQPYIQRIDQKHVEIDSKIMAYDHIFSSSTSQAQVFENIAQPVIDNVLEGYNGTIFAYGQTGSGKTHTIFGNIDDRDEQGLIPRVIQNLFFRKKVDDEIEISLLEIYKEDLIDLLMNKKDLKIKQTSAGIQIQNLTRMHVKSVHQALSIIQSSQKNRRVASTKLNDKSSRSHTILTLHLINSDNETKFCLIDLAGSEKVSKAGVTGENLEETKKINYSLSCLGNVINALLTRKKSDHIPFRDSKLTRILKDSLSGKFKTSIIVNCSADQGTNEETLSSLKFADRAKKIKVTISKNNLKGKQNVQYLHMVIKKLTCDLENTKKELDKYKEICHDGKNNEQSTGSIQCEHQNQVEEPQHNRNNQKIHKQKQCLPALNSERQMETEMDITPRQIPSQRANTDQVMKKYGKQNEFLKNRLKFPINSVKASQYSTKNNIIQEQTEKKEAPFNLNLNELSSLNVSRSVGNFFGEIHSPSISSLSIRNQDHTDDLSLNFSLQKSESNRESLRS